MTPVNSKSEHGVRTTAVANKWEGWRVTAVPPLFFRGIIALGLHTIHDIRMTGIELGPSLPSISGNIIRAKGGQITTTDRVPCIGLRKALEIARKQGAKSLELRAVMSLCRLWKRKAKKEIAYRELSKIYNWFTEGFDSPDLIEAKKLLEEVSF